MKNKLLGIVIGLSPSVTALAYDTFDLNSNTLTLNDLRINGVSNNVTFRYDGQTNASGEPILAVSSFKTNDTCSRGSYIGLNGYS